jgi:hypothetical protein
MARCAWWISLAVLAACGKDETSPTGDDDTDLTDPTGPTEPPTGPTDTGTPVVVPNYADAGIYGVERTDGTFASVTADCAGEMATFTPDGVPLDTVVVLAHNSLRTQDAFADLASHLASWGIPAITANLCASGVGALNVAEADAADLVAIAGASGASRHVFVGHVTGGLRAVLAAVDDPDAAAVIGLDLVDEPEAPAALAAADLGVPLLGLQGLATSCNVSGAGASVYATAPESTLLTVDQADTCDFEWPTDNACLLLCARPEEGRTEAAIQRTIRGLVTAGALWQLGADPLGEAYWTPGGAVYDDLVASGAIVP